MAKPTSAEGWIVNVVGTVGVGCVLIGIAVSFFAANWAWIAILGVVAFGVWFYFKSPWAAERAARATTARMLFQLSDVNLDPFPSGEEFAERVGEELATEPYHELSHPLFRQIMDAARRLYVIEGFKLSDVTEPPANLDSIEGAKYRDALNQLHDKLSSTRAYDVFFETVVAMFRPLVQSLPAPFFASDPNTLTFEVPMLTVASGLNGQIEEMIFSIFPDKVTDLGLFAALRQQLDSNLEALPKREMPGEYQGDDVITAYLQHTPLKAVFDANLYLSVPQHARFEHMHIVAGTGHGKTQTLQRFILSDLGTDAGLVIIDSQGEMLEKIARLKTNKEIIYIDPTDIEHPPALNMFDVSRLDGLSAAKREQFLNGLIELLEYVFAGLLKAELTQKQNVLFRYTLRLMLAVPNATLIDLVRFLAQPDEYLKHAEGLPFMVREFFNNELKNSSYNQTREQIRRRLYGVLENDAFRRMFSATANRLDIAKALDRGAVVLVDTAKSHLKKDASALLGRYFIALTLQAAMEREGSKNPAFLYIDEAGEYFDDNIDTLLNEARKRRVGIVMAHQYLDQLTPQLRSSIATNTSVKLAGGVSDKDARSLASDMRTDAEFIGSRQRGQFACFIKNVTPHAASISVPFGVLEAAPQRTDAQYRAFRNANREAVSEGVANQAPPAEAAPIREPEPADAEIVRVKDW